MPGTERFSSRGPARLALAMVFLLCAAMVAATAAQGMQAVAPDGSVFVAWGDVEVTRIGPDGVPSGSVYDIAPEPRLPEGPDQTENSHLVDMAVAPDGVVTLVWLDIVGWDARIMFRRLAPDGTPLGEPEALATDQEIHITPELGIGPDGTATVIWSRLASPGQEVVMRRIAPDGTPEAGVEALSTPGKSTFWETFATAADGTATVVWNENGEAGSNLLLERRVAPDGTPEPTTHQLATADGSIGEPRVEDAAGGASAVLWQEGTPQGEQLWTRRIDPAGTPEPAAHLLNKEEKAGFPHLTVAPDGTALVTWSLGVGAGVSGSFIDADGSPSAPVPLTANGSPLGARPSVASKPDGNFMLSWVGTCGSKECLKLGEIDEAGDVAEAVILDEGGSLGSGGGVFLPDGTGNYVWGRVLVVNGDRGALRTRRVASDGTLGPIHDLYEPEPRPMVSSYLHESGADFGDVEVGSESSQALPLFVESIEPLGTFSTSFTGPDADLFKVTGGTCGPEDAHPTNCSVLVSFEPDSDGPAAAELVIDAGEADLPLRIPLRGVGIPPPAPAVAPSVSGPLLRLGKPRAESSTGRAILSVAVPGPGSLSIAGPCVGGAAEVRSARAADAGVIELAIRAKSHCRLQLLRTGTTRFAVRATFAAADGETTVAHRPIRLWLSTR